jgi:hypothetical protein
MLSLSMPLDRRQRLEALPGWSWDPLSDQWEEGFSYLKAYSEREGHFRVPATYNTDDGYRLGSWARHQRKGKDVMPLDRRQRLEALPRWTWDALGDKWDESFSYLNEFSDREGHSRVPARYKTENGYRLGKWVTVQRQTRNTMDPDRRQRLEALPGWSWDPWADQWEEGFAQLKEFSDREDHCRVSQGYKTKDRYRLGSWVRNQRSAKNKMDLDRRQRLEALPGWVWKVE